MQTFAERAASGRRHPGHDDDPEDAAEVRAKLEAGLWGALDLPGELIEVDMTGGRVDVDVLADRVRGATA